MYMDPPTVTAQEHKVIVRNGKPVFFDPPELKAARAKLTAYLSQHRPDQPSVTTRTSSDTIRHSWPTIPICNRYIPSFQIVYRKIAK